MGLLDKLVASVVTVVAGLLGFGLLMAGGQQAAFGSDGLGTGMALVGIVLLVFAAKA